MGEIFMGNLLFSPSGRIGPGQFMSGYVVLIAINVVLSLLTGFVPALVFLAIPVGFMLLWISIVLWIKRYHDAGKSGWMCLIPIIIGGIIGGVIVSILSKMFIDPNAALAAAEAAEAAAEAGDIGGAFSAAMGAAKMSPVGVIITTIVGAVISYVIAMVFNNMIKHDAHDNQFGPEAGTA